MAWYLTLTWKWLAREAQGCPNQACLGSLHALLRALPGVPEVARAAVLVGAWATVTEWTKMHQGPNR